MDKLTSLRQFEASEAVAPPIPRSPGLAFALSALVPGVGQMYCGKWKMGFWTLAFFAGAIAGLFFFLLRSDGDGGESAGFCFRMAIVLYLFAFLDAFLTARELSSGQDLLPGGNPRIAAVLNLLTRGFGYFYLGESKKGFAVFFGLMLVARIPSVGFQLIIEALLIFLAVDGYRVCRKTYPLERSLPKANPILASVVYGLAGVIAGGYVWLLLLGLREG